MYEHRMDAVPGMSLLAEELFFGQRFRDGEVALVRPVVVVVQFGEVVFDVHGDSRFCFTFEVTAITDSPS